MISISLLVSSAIILCIVPLEVDNLKLIHGDTLDKRNLISFEKRTSRSTEYLTVEFQPNQTEGTDSSIATWFYKDTNYGNATWLRAGCDVTASRSLLLFNLSSLSNDTVIDATLFLWSSDGPDSSTDFCIRRITNDWIEGNGSSDNNPMGEATWNNQPNYKNEITFNQTISSDYIGWTEWNITSTTQHWIDNSNNNHGLMINATKEIFIGNNDIFFHSSDYLSNISRRPKLNITYMPFINTPPNFIDVNQSNNSIRRTNQISFYINCSDNEEYESNLTIDVQINDPIAISWKSNSISIPVFNNDRWELNYIPPKNATLGFYDIRFQITDSFGYFCNWYYMNDSFIVLNNFPISIDISINKTSSLRNKNIGITFNGSDVEQDEWNLTPHLEYRCHSGTIWDVKLLSNIHYNNNNWCADIRIPKNASMGYYDFRIRFNDSDGGFSKWYYFNKSLIISNDSPSILEINSSSENIFRNNSMFVYLYARDLETIESALHIELHYGASIDGWNNLTMHYDSINEYWEGILNIPTVAELGAYAVRAKVMDMDNDSSDWIQVDNLFNVINNPPVISVEFDDIQIRTRPVKIDVSKYISDIENDKSDLSWTLDEDSVDTSIFSIETPDFNDELLIITPIRNISRQGEITIKLIDKDGGYVIKNDISIIVDSEISSNAPIVSLLSPANGGIVNTVTPDLIWKVNYPEKENISYLLLLDTDSNSTHTVNNISNEYHTIINPLKDGLTYYWTIIPYTSSKDGICISNVWSFTVDLNFTPDYNVALSVEYSRIFIPQGTENLLNLTISNQGNSADVINLEIDYGTFMGNIHMIDSSPSVDSNSSILLEVEIISFDNIPLGDSQIVIKGSSQGSGGFISASVEFTISVIKKGTIAEFGINLSLEYSFISLSPRQSDTMNLTLRNIGTVNDDYSLSVSKADSNPIDIQLGVNSISLDSGSSINVTITLIIPNNMKSGIYLVNISVISLTVGENSTANGGLTLEIKGSTVNNNQTSSGNDNFTFVIILIIIITLLCVLTFYLKYKKLDKHELEQSEKDPNVQKNEIIKPDLILPPEAKQNLLLTQLSQSISEAHINNQAKIPNSDNMPLLLSKGDNVSPINEAQESLDGKPIRIDKDMSSNRMSPLNCDADLKES